MSNPIPEQWTPEQVSSAFADGNVEAIAEARKSGALSDLFNNPEAN